MSAPIVLIHAGFGFGITLALTVFALV